LKSKKGKMVDKKTKIIIKQALKEDIDGKDITTYLSIPAKAESKAFVIAKENGIICGIKVMEAVFKEVDKKMVFSSSKTDGSSFRRGERIAVIKGRSRSILTAERVALNFLSLLCGIATATEKLACQVKGSKAKILDTRKTTPLLRDLEKYAVRAGGGHNHRNSLAKGVMMKDNHLKAGKYIYKGKIDSDKLKKLIASMRKKTRLKIEVEVESLAQFQAAAKCSPDIIMLDNFLPKDIKAASYMRDKLFPKIKLEASGGINLSNIRQIAYAGVDFISVGAVTHSPQAIDFSLEIL